MNTNENSNIDYDDVRKKLKDNEDALMKYSLLHSSIEESIEEYGRSQMKESGNYCINFLRGRLLKDSNVIEYVSSDLKLLLMILDKTLQKAEYAKLRHKEFSEEEQNNFKTEFAKFCKEFPENEKFNILQYSVHEREPLRGIYGNIPDHLTYSGERCPILKIMLAHDMELHPFADNRSYISFS